MKLMIASNNAHKVSEIKAILGCFYDEILSLREAGIDMDVVEDANTFEGNALKKAREVFAVAMPPQSTLSITLPLPMRMQYCRTTAA